LQGEINSPSSWPPKLKLFQEGNKNIFDIKNKPTCIPNTQTCINYAVPWPGLVSSSRSRNNKNWTTARKSMLPQPSIYFQLVSPNPQSACHFMPDPFILNWRSLFTRQASKAVAANDLLFLTIFTEFFNMLHVSNMLDSPLLHAEIMTSGAGSCGAACCHAERSRISK
jgi:hypothetical protein